ncbi:MAG: polysaccharide biosynthesis C-terminal domain-containing protein [Emcibacteraceae bacterium]|nr:polysaccharide biosynthesis C-terminal domain-containing protein [Emcibacteraceae bacterium]
MKISSDLKLYIIAKIVTVFSWVLIINIFTQNLTPTEYGNYSLTYTLIILISSGGTVWITTSFVRFYPEFIKKNKQQLFYYLGVKAAIPSIIAGLFLFLSIIGSLYFLDILQYNFIIYLLISLSLLGHMVFLLYSTYLSAVRDIKRYVLLVSGQIFLYVSISTILFNYSEFKIEAIFCGMLLSYLPIILMIQNPKSYIKTFISFTKRVNTVGLTKYRIYGFPILFMSVSIQLNSVADQYILKFYNLHNEVGMYAAFYTLSEKSLFMVYQVLSISTLPIAFRYWENGEFNRSYKLFWKIIIAYMVISLIGIIILLNFDYELTSLLINQSYMEGVFIIPYILIGVFLGGCAALFSDVLLLKKQTMLLAKCYISAAIINIVLNFILIPQYGMIGAASSTLISYTIIFILLFYYMKRNTGMLDVIFRNRMN